MFKIKGIHSILALLLMLLFATSCSKYQKLLKSTDNELKLEKAIEYYDKGDYHRAIGLLTDVIPAFRGTQKAELINYYYAMAHFKQRDYVMASHYFRTFNQAFPNNEHAQEFLFLAAYCKYLDSPRSSLDQTTTLEAIRDFQIFINRYPANERVEEANQLIDELRLKQEKKVFDLALLYYNLTDYIASVTTFNNLIRDFPDSKYREEALFNIVRANFEYAQQSIPERQTERFNNVLSAHSRLIRHYPDSRFLTQADRMRENARAQIERLAQIQEVTENK
jgi:outer membrane protein assembly factor BamD